MIRPLWVGVIKEERTMGKISIDWFEIPVQDLARAETFYSRALACELTEMAGPSGPFKAFQNGGEPVGALVLGEHNEPARIGTLLYFHSDDIDATLARIEAAGGQVVVPKMAIGPFGHIAQFTDTEGNRLALHSA